MSKIKRALAALLALVLVMAVGPQAMAAEAGTYAQEQGLEFTQETEFTAPFLAYLTVDGEYAETVPGQSLTPIGDARYTIESVSLSQPDEEGMVHLEIETSVKYRALYEQDPDEEYIEIGCYSVFCGFTLFDLYSGYTIPIRRVSGNGEAKNTVELTVDDKTVTVMATKSAEYTKNGWFYGCYSKYGTWQNVLIVECTMKYSAVYPADYDGLCLAFWRPGYTEYKEYDPDAPLESEPLIEEDETGDDYYCIRVTDLVAAFGAEG